MGYLSRFWLEAPGLEITEDLMEEIDDCYAKRALSYGEEVKWYYHEHDLQLISKKYSGILFKLSVVGDSHDDIKVKLFYDGKICRFDGEITPKNGLYEEPQWDTVAKET